jgi:hypothetical protein
MVAKFRTDARGMWIVFMNSRGLFDDIVVKSVILYICPG